MILWPLLLIGDKHQDHAAEIAALSKGKLSTAPKAAQLFPPDTECPEHALLAKHDTLNLHFQFYRPSSKPKQTVQQT